MPLFDVLDAIDDEFVDEIIVIRRPEAPSQYGRQRPRQELPPIVTWAVVEPLSGEIPREEDQQTSAKTIRVTTEFRLQAATPGRRPDVVVVDNANDAPEPFLERYAADPRSFEHYEFTDFEDFSRFGAGFVTAVCTLVDLLVQPPAT